MIGAARASTRPQKQTSKVVRFPAPVGGIDIRQSLGSNDLQHCVYTYNLCPFEHGLRVREGYQEWQVGLNTGVHTLIPFDNAVDGSSGDRLFAVTSEGIWDVTDYDTAPVSVATFADQSADAGYGTFTHYVNQAETDILFYADSVNGLWEYDSLTDMWSVPAGITGMDVADVKFVMSHKNNVWFCLKDSTVGYYLPILANSGEVTAQHFGDKFAHGGTLEGLFSWTIDGGSGVDDILVAVSHAGDVILYTGSGPDETDWGMKGIYYIGEIPNTPRFGSEQGGALQLLSAYGLVSMSDLLQGVDTAALQSDINGTSMAHKISGLIREDMKTKIDLRGWNVRHIPTEGGLLISSPTLNNALAIQYYYNLSTQGWGLWRGVPMDCFTEFGGVVYFGTADGRVMKMDVDVDDRQITPESLQFNGEDIEFSILTAFTSMELDGMYKRIKLIRPDFLAILPPITTSQARYDYDLHEGLLSNVSTPQNATVGEWDISDWDAVVWGSALPTPHSPIGGTWGHGRYVAIATKGSSRSRTRLVGWDVIFDQGGPLI